MVLLLVIPEYILTTMMPKEVMFSKRLLSIYIFCQFFFHDPKAAAIYLGINCSGAEAAFAA
jgi:hypothetical protein